MVIATCHDLVKKKKKLKVFDYKMRVNLIPSAYAVVWGQHADISPVLVSKTMLLKNVFGEP